MQVHSSRFPRPLMTLPRSGGQGFEEGEEGGGEEEGEEGLWDEDSCEEEGAGGGEGGDGGVEGCTGAEGLVGPAVGEERKEEDGEGLGEVGGEGVEAEDAEGEGSEPVGEGSFFEVADAVYVEGDEVSGEGHVLGGLGVGGVGIVKEGRGEEADEEDGKPEAKDDEGGVAGAGASGEGCCEEGEVGLVGHRLVCFDRIRDCLEEAACARAKSKARTGTDAGPSAAHRDARCFAQDDKRSLARGAGAAAKADAGILHLDQNDG